MKTVSRSPTEPAALKVRKKIRPGVQLRGNRGISATPRIESSTRGAKPTAMNWFLGMYQSGAEAKAYSSLTPNLGRSRVASKKDSPWIHSWSITMSTKAIPRLRRSMSLTVI